MKTTQKTIELNFTSDTISKRVQTLLTFYIMRYINIHY